MWPNACRASATAAPAAADFLEIRHMRMFKFTALVALAALVGCAKMRGTSNGDSVTTTVSLPRAQALDIARTQLVHHGFTVTGAGSDVLVTSPKAVPDYL